MRKVEYVCDICGEPIKKKVGNFSLPYVWINGHDDKVVNSNVSDLCYWCAVDLAQMIDELKESKKDESSTT